jgi:hypothetical protein
MRPNPLFDAVSFLLKPEWTTAVFWLLLLGSAAAAFYSWRRDPAQRSIQHVGIGVLRVIVGCMWWQQSLWKIPPHYDWGLIHWMEEMVKHASTQLQSDLVRDLVLPNIAIFGPLGYAIEVAIAVSLILGLATRRGARRADGDQPLAGALRRARRMALDLYVPGRLAGDLLDRSARAQPRG